MSDDKAKAAKKLKDKDEFKRLKKSTVGKASLARPKPTGPPPTEFIQKLSKEGLDKFISQALESKQIEDVKILDLSRHKISELSPRVKFYMRMLRQLEKLNLYANKLRKLPGEVGTWFDLTDCPAISSGGVIIVIALIIPSYVIYLL